MEDRASLILETEIPNIWLVANNEYSDPLNDPVPENWELHQTCVLEFVEEECQQFDIVLADFPPSLYLLAWATLIASDYVAIPVPPEMFATQGLQHVHRMILQAREIRPSLRRLGHFVTRRKRSKTHTLILDDLRNRFGREMFTATLSEYHDAMEVSALGAPLEQCRPYTKAAHEIRALCEEMLQRMDEWETRNSNQERQRKRA
jgi:chromosome partitioning protein